MSVTVEPLRADPAACQTLLATLQDRIGTQKYNAWFKHGTHLSVDADRVLLTVPNPFVANWIETHYQQDLAAAAETHLGVRTVTISVDADLSGDLRKAQRDAQAQIVERTGEGRTRPRNSIMLDRPALRHKLGDFVVGEGNKLAYSAALLVGGGGKAPFNPLFIHGHCGVGKTHLLQGICNAIAALRRSEPLSWRYVTGEQFTNDFITGLRTRKLDEFRARYRKLHLLAIDDVHFFAAKKATQEEFLHTFNALETAGAQIVMASDAHPRLVGELNAQLVSRFVAGMVVKIDGPDRATRMEILRRRAKAMKLHVPNDVLEYVAEHVRGSVRELEGSLVKMGALASLEGGKITLEMAGATMADRLARTDSAITLGDIESVVAAYFGITPADIQSSRRTRTVSVARMVAMLLARRHTRMSYPEIGRAMGKNHSSVVLAVQRIEHLLDGDELISWSTPVGPKSLSARKLVQLLTEQIV